MIGEGGDDLRLFSSCKFRVARRNHNYTVKKLSNTSTRGPNKYALKGT